MKSQNPLFLGVIAALPLFCVPASATVTIVSLSPSATSPRPLGTAITWTAKATDTGAGPLTFQFNVGPPGKAIAMVKDFNVGTLSAGVWTSLPFVWVPTANEGNYQIQVVVKDFGTNTSQTKTAKFTATPLATGTTPVITATANPLVAIFSAPACAVGSSMRVSFQVQSGSKPATLTNWVGCNGTTTMNFEIAGMSPSTGYYMHAQTKTGSTVTNGATRAFTAGVIPSSVVLPTIKLVKAYSGTNPNPLILHSLIQFGFGTNYADVATDLAGNIIWYYYAANIDHFQVIVRPLTGGGVLTIEDDYAWDPNVYATQFLRQVDLAGNVVKETNIGVLQQQLMAKGFTGVPCTSIATPAPIGSACIGAFHHDAIQTLPNGHMALFVSEEKIFPPGTQGDTSGLPVDIIGDMILVVDSNWQITWFWDAFDGANGGNGYPQLPVSRTAVLGDTCGTTTAGCPPVYLLSPGNIAPLAHDWLHSNSLYYWPAPQDGNSTGGDIIWSSRHQDWVFKIDYKDGTGTGNILWRMGPSGDFTNTNPFSDPWPWFSHQHDVGIEGNGSGVMTLMDNGNTRTSSPSLSTGGVPGLGLACGPWDCNSRGMALTFNESSMTVTPVESFDLGNFSTAMGSAELLSDGNYFFENPAVLVNLSTIDGYSMEIGPTPAAPELGAADVLLNVSGPEHYRAFQMSSLYAPPTT